MEQINAVTGKAYCNKTYRIRYRYRQWVGKPDPSGFGIGLVYSDDCEWIHSKAAELHRRGCRGISIQK